MTPKKKSRTFDTYVLIFFIIIFAAVLTYIIPVGKFSVHKVSYKTTHGVALTHEAIVPNSFRFLYNKQGKPLVKSAPIFNSTGGSYGITNYMFEGLVSGDKWGSAIGVVIFILVIGGTLGVVIKTGAIECGILRVIDRVKGKEIAIIPVLFVLFSLGGAIFGMAEECIAFAAVIVPVIIALGYDGITAVMVSYVASQIGYATSPLNPFCAMIAQGIAGVPILSGANFRWLLWLFFTGLGIFYTLMYARCVKKHPHRSLSYDSDAYFRDDFKTTKKQHVAFGLGHFLVILSLFGCLGWIIWGVLEANYFIPQLATIFFILGLISGIIGIIFKLNNMTLNSMAEAFRAGSRDLLGAALIVGMAKGILLVLGGSNPTSPTVLNTLLHYSSHFLRILPASVSAWFMYVFQILMRFLVVSTSGQAALTMPLIAPIASLIGLSKQIAVLTYQLSNFGGAIFPTDAALIGVLAVARINWINWAKSQYKLQLLLFICGSAFVLFALHIGYR